jgi:hypothetical protein
VAGLPRRRLIPFVRRVPARTPRHPRSRAPRRGSSGAARKKESEGGGSKGRSAPPRPFGPVGDRRRANSRERPRLAYKLADWRS